MFDSIMLRVCYINEEEVEKSCLYIDLSIIEFTEFATTELEFENKGFVYRRSNTFYFLLSTFTLALHDGM